MTNLYCEENNMCQGQRNSLIYTKKFWYSKDTKEVFNTAQTELTVSNF